jgi:hypothetical protein
MNLYYMKGFYVDNYCLAFCLVYNLDCHNKVEGLAKATSDSTISQMIVVGQKVAQIQGITPAQLAALLQLIATIASLLGGM